MKKNIDSTSKQQNPLLRLFLTGFGMGSADIVPGVSGGTIAFIFGIYEELINSIKTVTSTTLQLILKLKFKEAIASIPFKFLIPLFGGIFTAIFTLSKLISYLLTNQPIYIWSFFFGLVITSIILVSKKITKWETPSFIALILSSIVAYMIVGAVPQETPANLLAFFLSGAVAICAMILPGISGSFLLVIMGKYHQILEAVNNRDFLTLIVFMLGAAVGLALFSRVLSWLFKNHHNLTIATLTGFMIGSLRKVWPWKETILTRLNSHGEIVPVVQQNILPDSFDQTVIFAVLLAFVAAVLMLYLSKFDNKKEE